MTTDRTAIRRRLAIRSAAHRPPWGARKAGHGSIVAPLAATVAATVVVGVGVGLALARSERERRRARQHDQRQLELQLERQLALAPGERLADGLRRIALGQVDLALELLGADQHGASTDGAGAARPPDETAVHETRKALKRLRALLRLLEGELGPATFARENAVLRDVARSLSGARDAAVMLATLDALIERHPRALGRRRGVLELRRRVRAEHARMERLTLADPAVRAAVLGDLYAFRLRAAAWSLSERDGIRLIEADLARLYRQGRTRYLRVVRRRGDRMLTMHEWRKRVKDLRYAAEMLERRDVDGSRTSGGSGSSGSGKPGGSGKSGGSRKSGDADGELRRLVRRADALGELLGEEHDLAVLAEHLRAGARGEGANETWDAGRRTRDALLERISRRRRAQRKRALRDGKRLYREDPDAFIRRVRAAYARQERRLS